MIRARHAVIACTAACLLIACGGGGGDSVIVTGGTGSGSSGSDSGSGGTTVPLPAPTALGTAVRGVVAVGAPLVGAQVRARCLGGDRQALASTDAQGTYTIELQGAAPPCLLQARDGTVAGAPYTGLLHGLAPAVGMAPLTPFTELALAHAYGRAPAAVFTAFRGEADIPAETARSASAAWLNTQLLALGVAAPSGDIFSDDLEVGDPNDQLLDALAARMSAASATLADLRLAASTASGLQQTLATTRAAADQRAAQEAAARAAAEALEEAADTVAGIATTGVAIADAAVDVRCAAGFPQTTARTDAQGRFSLRLYGATVPCVIQVRDGQQDGVASTQVLHGWVTQGGSTVQVTSLSELVLGHAWGDRPANIFAQYGAGNVLGAQALSSARSTVFGQLAALQLATAGVDGLAGTYATGDATDTLLRNLTQKLYDLGSSQSAIAAVAAARGDIAASVTADRNVAVQFAAVAGETPVACGSTVQGLGRDGIPARVLDFRFYVSEAALVRADGAVVRIALGTGSPWQHVAANGDGVTLIDLEDGTAECATEGTAGTNPLLWGTVPAGRYTGLRLTLGVPQSLNHTDTAVMPSPLDSFAMGWSWQAGRKFAKIEVTEPTPGAWRVSPFYVHLGSTGCTGNPGLGQVQCTTPNRGALYFAAFDPQTQKVAVDLRALLAGTDITINQGGALGCMSAGTDRDCEKVFAALGIHWVSTGQGTGLPIEGGSTQTVFRAVAK